jgi:predicted regulator of Ras-like GTPase activity (Roadblock/LC7/MglB family)
MDLARAVMLALKMRDERRAAEQERQTRRDAPTNGHGRTALQQTLEQFVSATPFALQACVLRPDGTSVAEAADQARPVEAADLLRSSLCALAAAYPRDGLRRILVDDSAGTGCLVPVGNEGFLLVLATKEASLGALTVAAGRLAATAV